MESIEELVEFALNLISQHTGKPLTIIQKIILRESLSGNKKTYEQIASENGYSENYIKRGVAPKLWQEISNIIGEKINRANCRLLLEKEFKELSVSVVPNPISTPQKINLEIPDGQVPLNSPLYIERGVEKFCYQEILKSGAFIRIKAPRKMGKTSLITRILAYGHDKNYHRIYLNLHSAEREILTSTEKFVRWLCANIVRQLGLKSKLDEYWDEEMGNLINCTIYLREYLLKKISRPVILALDELDKLFEYPYVASDILALLRTWNEQAKNICNWNKLRIVIVNSTDAYITLQTNRSPLNIGVTIGLLPFTSLQIENLVHRHKLDLNSTELEQLMEITGGFPYLVRLALYNSLCSQISLEKCLRNAATDTGIFSNYLHEQLWYLKQNSDLADAFKVVVATNRSISIEQEMAFKLKSLGLVNLEGNQVTVSCGLYRKYFRNYFGLSVS